MRLAPPDTFPNLATDGWVMPESTSDKTLLCLSYFQACKAKIWLVMDKYLEISVVLWRDSQSIFSGISYHVTDRDPLFSNILMVISRACGIALIKRGTTARAI